MEYKPLYDASCEFGEDYEYTESCSNYSGRKRTLGQE